jgi:protocatechuate 3,4-dioxygenase beta subunit
MNARFLPGIILSAFLLFFLSACSGGHGPFSSFNAQALDSDGNPLRGVTVLVNGANTGITADNMGAFSLDASHFTNGVNSINQVSIGEKGVILFSRAIIPADMSTIVFQFPKGNGPFGSVTGYVFDDLEVKPIEEALLTLFSEQLGLFQTSTMSDGKYDFSEIPAGAYRITAQKDGYHTGVGMVNVESNSQTYQGLSLQPKNKQRYQDGIMVSGYVTNKDTQLPVQGTSVSITVDTGFIGIPEPWLIDPVMPDNPTPREDDPDQTLPGSNDLGAPTMPPTQYDPQYQETTTNESGYFEFELPVVGYGLYINYSKSDYLSSGDYFDIYSATEDMVINKELQPLVMTSARGKVLDGDGQPVKGAYVEFIFAGEEIKHYDDGGPEIGMPMDPGWGGFKDAVDNSFGSGGSVPSAPPSYELGGETGDGSNPLDNPLMQRYRWENQNQREGADAGSDQGFFGYYSDVTDDTGEFSFDSIAVGAYYVFATAYKHESINTDVTIVVDADQNYFELVINAIPVGSVTGVVIDESGKPVPEALVNCVQPFVDPFTYTDDQGNYKIDNIPVGDWIVSAFKYGYITDSKDTAISEDDTVIVNLQIQSYVPPQVDTVHFSGRVVDGATGAGIEGARMIFTTMDNQFFFDSTSSTNGFYTAELIPTQYNVLIQHPDFQDLYIGFWVDSLYPQYDFSLLPISGGWGPWGGIFGGGGSFEDGGQAGGGAPTNDPTTPSPFDPDEVMRDRR